MRRTVFGGSLADLPKVETDVVIVGSGAAGLYTALQLDPALDCVLLNKLGSEQCNSMYAQGGIAAVVEQSPFEVDSQKHFEDTLVAGAGLCDPKAVRVLVDEADENIQTLIQWGVPFDRTNGNLSLTREGGHSENRILHCGGDASGLYLTERLFELACARRNLRIMDHMMLVDILTNDNGVTGVIAINAQNMPMHFVCSRVVLCTGGIGRVYRNSTNAACSTGDGIAATLRAGVQAKDMEFVQFHPTALVHPDRNGRFFLISEALRGEGAVLRNRDKEAFMQGTHPLADLAPRDIVSRAIIKEMQRKNLPNVYLDITSKSRVFLKKRFPTIYAECMRRDIDIAIDWIPVIPVQHYFMGGVPTDLWARTNIQGLYACGESACTGVQGANRLASNSLLECLVFGRRCARDINGAQLGAVGEPDYSPQSLGKGVDALDLDSFSTEMRELMTRKCSIIRNGRDLTAAGKRIGEIYAQLDGVTLCNPKAIETYNIATVAGEIVKAALARKRSVGAHFRSDE